jgi:hypothetical protein
LNRAWWGSSLVALVFACPPAHTEDPESLKRQAAQAERRAEVSEEERAVLALFNAYRDAMSRYDGDVVVELVGEETIALYDRYLQQAITLDRGGLEALRAIDLVTVLRIRMEYRPERLLEIDGKELLADTIARRWTGDVSDLRLEEIEVEGERASATAAGHGREPVFFVREAGEWRIDLVRYLEQSAGPLFETLYARQGEEVPLLEWALGQASTAAQMDADPSILEPLAVEGSSG